MRLAAVAGLEQVLGVEPVGPDAQACGRCEPGWDPGGDERPQVGAHQRPERRRGGVVELRRQLLGVDGRRVGTRRMLRGWPGAARSEQGEEEKGRGGSRQSASDHFGLPE